MLGLKCDVKPVIHFRLCFIRFADGCNKLLRSSVARSSLLRNPNVIFGIMRWRNRRKKMCSSTASPSSIFLSICGSPVVRSRSVPIFTSSTPFLNSRRCKNPRLCLSSAVSETSSEVSWASPELNASDGYGGWAVVESPFHKKKKGSPQFRLSKPSCSIFSPKKKKKTVTKLRKSKSRILAIYLIGHRKWLLLSKVESYLGLS